MPLHTDHGVPFPGNLQPGFSTHVVFGCASLDRSHGMFAGNLELLRITEFPRLMQEVWLWVEARLCWPVLVETYDKKNPHGIQW